MRAPKDVQQLLDQYYVLSTQNGSGVGQLLVSFLATTSDETEKQDKLLELAKKIRIIQDSALFPLILNVFERASDETKTFILHNQ